MTIRIDGVLRPNERHGWRWYIKGVYGRGIYGTVCTRLEAPGLYLHHPDDKSYELIDESFTLSDEILTIEAIGALEKVLCALGWGPVVTDE